MLVSIIVPVCGDSAESINRLLESCMTQTHRDIEIVVVDDACSEARGRILSEFARRDSRIRICRHAKARGQAAARNTGIAASAGEWLQFVDHQDLILPNKTEMMLRHADPQTDLICCDLVMWDPVMDTAEFKVSHWSSGRKQMLQGMFSGNPAIPLVWMVRKKFLEKVGMFDESLEGADDWELLFRMLRFGNCKKINSQLAIHSIPAPLSSRAREQKRGDLSKAFLKALKATPPEELLDGLLPAGFETLADQTLEVWRQRQSSEYDFTPAEFILALYRMAHNESTDESQRTRIREKLSGLEHADPFSNLDLFSHLTVNQNKDAGSGCPLVSIVIPSFKPDFFEEALSSAINQTYPNIEIVVSDNCPTDAVKTIVDGFQGKRPITYFANPEKLNKNDQKCFDLANGEYVKFLLDDDLLDKECVARMVEAFERHGEKAKLVTSRRQKVDDLGRLLPDDRMTAPIFSEDICVDGKDLALHVLCNLLNVIGEFTTVMFRKRDLEGVKPYFFDLNGREYASLNDLSTWVSLLSRGDAVYIAQTLSYFRIHGGMSTAGNEFIRFKSVVEWLYLMNDARRIGIFKQDELYRTALQNLSISFGVWESDGKISAAYQEEFKTARLELAEEIESLRRMEAKSGIPG